MVNIRIFENRQEAGLYAATLAEQVILHAEKPVLGLATGSTAIPFYDALVRFARCGLSFQHVTTLNLDEYVGLTSAHPQSYHWYMWHHFHQHVDIPPENIHLPRGDSADLAQECQRYDTLLKRCPIDFQILGLGQNGHIGFNEPADALVSQTHVVRLSAETLHSNSRFFDSEEKVPHTAVTMGVQSILQAGQIVLMAFGLDKADIVAKSVKGAIRTDVPASMLQLHHNVTFVLDRESSSKLANRLA